MTRIAFFPIITIQVNPNFHRDLYAVVDPNDQMIYDSVFFCLLYSTMYNEIARCCLKAFKSFHEMLIDLLMEDDQHAIVYSSEFFVLLKENMG